MDVKNTTNKGYLEIVMLKGKNGKNIATIEKTATTATKETFTVTLEDGRTKQFEVTRGLSISSIKKTKTVGLVDTYTVTLNDDSTFTFDVMNGQSYQIPTDGVIWYTGSTVPEGYEVVAPPPLN